jgi:hypothetical protein
MSYHAYTILECTNPSLISSGSTFVEESNSVLLKIENNKSHFDTNRNSMEYEIYRISIIYPEETFTAKWHWGDDVDNRIVYTVEFKDGKHKVLGIEPDYFFFMPGNISPSDEHAKAFRDHVLEYLNRLDYVNKVSGDFEIDILSNEKDRYGYKSQITITYENDQYKWTATRTGISFIEVTVEEKESRIHNSREITDLTELLGCDDDGVPSYDSHQ